MFLISYSTISYNETSEQHTQGASRPQLRCLHSRRDLILAVNRSSAGLYGDTFKGQPVCMEKLNGLVGFTDKNQEN